MTTMTDLYREENERLKSDLSRVIIKNGEMARTLRSIRDHLKTQPVDALGTNLMGDYIVDEIGAQIDEALEEID